MDVEMDLIVSFPDQTETFTLGVEAGMFWQRLQHGERAFEFVAHISNLECLRRMAKAMDTTLDVHPSEVEGWVECSVGGESSRPSLKLIRGGLSVDKQEANP